VVSVGVVGKVAGVVPETFFGKISSDNIVSTGSVRGVVKTVPRGVVETVLGAVPGGVETVAGVVPGWVVGTGVASGGGVGTGVGVIPGGAVGTGPGVIPGGAVGTGVGAVPGGALGTGGTTGTTSDTTAGVSGSVRGVDSDSSVLPNGFTIDSSSFIKTGVLGIKLNGNHRSSVEETEKRFSVGSVEETEKRFSVLSVERLLKIWTGLEVEGVVYGSCVSVCSGCGCGCDCVSVSSSSFGFCV
jgi:hypothetical protein